MFGEIFSVLVIIGHISAAISGAEKIKEVVVDGQPIVNFHKTYPAVQRPAMKRRIVPTQHGSSYK